jgi:hypothetical protein
MKGFNLEKFLRGLTIGDLAAGFSIVISVIQLDRMISPKEEPKMLVVNNYYYDDCHYAYENTRSNTNVRLSNVY